MNAPHGRLRALLPTKTLRAPSLILGFSAVLALGLGALALLLGSEMKDRIVSERLNGAESAAEVFASVTLDADEFHNGRLTAEAKGDLDNAVAEETSITGLRVWDMQHHLLYASSEELSGEQEEPSDGFIAATHGQIASEITSEAAEAADIETEQSLEDGDSIEVYVPVRDVGGGTAPVVEAYMPVTFVRADVATATRRLYLILGVAALLIFMALLPSLVRSSRALAESRERRHPALQRKLRHAMRHDELVVHYQPKIDLRSGRITGVEALVRWQLNNGTLVPPGSFLPKVEQTEIMKPLTMHVMELALKQSAQWKREGLSLGIAVNLSPANLADEDLPAQLAGLVQKHGVLPDQITLEITETAVMSDPDAAVRTMTTLGGLGFRLSIDDFGTGQSNLSRLDQLPFRELKVDISLVRALEATNDTTLVKSIVGLAHQLELWVVAEGVETDSTKELLTELGCDVAQGFLISRPVEADRIADLVHDYEFRRGLDALAATERAEFYAAGL